MAFVLRRQPEFSPKHAAYPYQLDAIRAIKDLPYAAIFHEQGLGKTKIAIDLALSWLQSDTVDTVFVVTKKSLVKNWGREVAGHCHITPHILSGNRRQNSASLNSPVLLYVTNYEVISANAQISQAVPPDLPRRLHPRRKPQDKKTRKPRSLVLSSTSPRRSTAA